MASPDGDTEGDGNATHRIYFLRNRHQSRRQEENSSSSTGTSSNPESDASVLRHDRSDDDTYACRNNDTTGAGPSPELAPRPGDRGENASVAEAPLQDRRQLLERIRTLREENRRLRGRGICVCCRQRPVALTLLPCGHFNFCEECGASCNVCPLCHQTVLADIRTFLL